MTPADFDRLVDQQFDDLTLKLLHGVTPALRQSAITSYVVGVTIAVQGLREAGAISDADYPACASTVRRLSGVAASYIRAMEPNK